MEERPERLNKLIFSTTQYIEGANIDKYLGIVSGVVVLGAGIFSELDAGVADMLGIRSTMFQSKLEKARTAALNELSKSAVDKGANAVVGIDINYLGLGSNTLMVSANGTAVSFSKKV
ncbi:MAG: YbjQ family protein [Bacteroidota bacterium]